MIRRVRITPQKIKLVVHNTEDNNTNNYYRVYNLNNDVAVWFEHKEQILNYYRSDTLFIDVDTSRIITFDRPTISQNVVDTTINNKVIFKTYSFNAYNTTYGQPITRSYAQDSNDTYILLEDNNELYMKIDNTINKIRRLHITRDTPKRYNIKYANEWQWQLLDSWTGYSNPSRNTRPYHTTESRNVVMIDSDLRRWRYSLVNNNYVGRLDSGELNNIAQDIASVYPNTIRVEYARNDVDTTQNTSTRHDLLHSYHSGPRNITPKNATNDTSTRYFGIELETELRTLNNVAEYTTALHRLMNPSDRDFELIKFERDGSLSNGVEIITQPMSIAYIIENKDKFKEMLALIDSMGATSHDNGRCGMHIHVSKSEINDNTHSNLWLIFECFYKELTMFSRRTSMSWCNFMCNTLRNNHINYIDKDYIDHNKPMGNDHHSAINNGNSNTTEIRIFRGTTNFQTFMANIQLVDNLVSIAREDNINGITWETIINYNIKYTELMEYNRRKNINSTKVLGTIVDIR